jgi:hypothetical protein
MASVRAAIRVWVRRGWWTEVVTLRSIVARIGLDSRRRGESRGVAHGIMVNGVRVVVRRRLVVVRRSRVVVRVMLLVVWGSVSRWVRLRRMRGVVVMPARLVEESSNAAALIAGVASEGDAVGAGQLGEGRQGSERCWAALPLLHIDAHGTKVGV